MPKQQNFIYIYIYISHTTKYKVTIHKL